MAEKPKPASSLAEKELEKCEKQFEEFDKNVKELTQDRMNKAPKEDAEPQTKLSQSEIEKAKEIYLKPKRTVSSKEKFDEKWRDDYEFSKENVRFIAENKEIIGETIELWTKPFPGVPAQEWAVPVNIPLWGPRHLAERLTNCKYHRLVMQKNIMTGSDGKGQYYGAMAADTTIQRLDAIPVSSKKSIFMGAVNF